MNDISIGDLVKVNHNGLIGKVIWICRNTFSGFTLLELEITENGNSYLKTFQSNQITKLVAQPK